MTVLPEPMTPPDSDLRDFQFMPLDVVRFAQSDLVALEDPQAVVAALLLWGASWHASPAGSLTDDDRTLSHLAGYGRATKEWLKVKPGALRGFVKCADGRLYHPVVAEKVLESWAGKLRQRHRTFCAAIRKHNERSPADKREAPSFEAWESFGRPTTVTGKAAAMSRVTGADVARDMESSVTPQSREKTVQGTGTGTGTGILKEESFALVGMASGDLIEEQPSAKRRRAYPDAFEAVWKTYPHVEGRSSKEKAHDQWKALPCDEQAALPGAIQRFRPKVSTVCGDRGAPCMSRWLKDAKHLNYLGTGAGSDVVKPEVWAQAVEMWRSGEGWSESLGPAPDEPGTRVPRSMLLVAHNDDSSRTDHAA